MKRRTKEDMIIDVLIYISYTILLIIVLYPLYIIVISSISNPVAIYDGKVLFRPMQITFEGYERIFRDSRIWTGYRNSIFYTSLGIVVSVTLTLLLAYPLSIKQLKGKRFINIYILVTMYFNGGIIPTYIIIRNLGLYDKWIILVILNCVMGWYVFVARTFFQSTIPEELREAAYIDGCGTFQFFIVIAMPLSKALIAIMALFYGVFQWNDFFRALIYIRKEAYYPLQLVLRSILIESSMDAETSGDFTDSSKRQLMVELMNYGVIVVASLPMLVLYPFLQKYFVKGVMIGSLKG